ncbi:GGDEF domain-containing protein [Aromatoleum sp.]|uniref:GGDEF domain-containing protein n=1 Tax=Aromatoleum sp. TaxID=2307007 RepID=UPI002FCC618A
MKRTARRMQLRVQGTGGSSTEVRNIALFVLVVILTLGGHFYFYAYPLLVQCLVEESERDAVRAAGILRVVAHRGADASVLPNAHVSSELDSVRRALGVMKFRIFDRDGRITFSTEPSETGRVNENTYFRDSVAAGDTRTNLLRRNESSLDGDTYVRDLVEIYVPLMEQGRFGGAFEIYYDITEQRKDFDQRLRAMSLNLGGLSAILLAVFAVIVVRSYTNALRSERRHSRQLHQEIERRLEIEEELRESHGRYRHLAHHDSLTGIPNRTLFLDRFQHALANARRYETRLGLLFIDLDHFKTINDTWGHEAGDRILKAAANVLQKCIRESDTAARIAGDEFAVLVEHADEGTVTALVDRLAREFANGLDFGIGDISTSASIGISLYPQDGEDIETLFRHADIAMYRAKADRRGSWQYFAAEPATDSARG